MANIFISLPVPASIGVGAWVDVSSMGPERTISVDGGAFDGSILIEGSNDAQASSPPAAVGPFNGPTFAPQLFVQAWNFLRVRRVNGNGGTPSVNLAAPPSISNVYAAMTVPASDGVGAATDISTGGDVTTFTCMGAFTGQILIETSTDGVNFSPTLLFEIGGGIGFTVAGVLSAARVRRRGPGVGGTPLVSVGSQATNGGGGGGFPGYGGAPPAIAATSAAGVSALVSRADHTHRGALESGSYTVPGPLNANGLISQTVVAGVATLAITAIPTSFPGFGGAPPAIASASAAGAAGTASRSDHTHALDLVAYNPSLVGLQAGGVLQQTYGAPTATPAAFAVAPGLVPYGADASGILATEAAFNYNAATNTLTVDKIVANAGTALNLFADAGGAGVSGISIAAGVGNPITFTGSLIPSSSGGYDLGSLAAQMRTIYVQELDVLGVGGIKFAALAGALYSTVGTVTIATTTPANVAINYNNLQRVTANAVGVTLFDAGGAVDCLKTAATGNVMLGRDTATATGAINGFPWMPAPLGNPTGVVTVGAFVRAAAFCYDQTNNRFAVFNPTSNVWGSIPVAFTVASGAGLALIANAPGGIISLAAKWEQFNDIAGVASYRAYYQ